MFLIKQLDGMHRGLPFLSLFLLLVGICMIWLTILPVEWMKSGLDLFNTSQQFKTAFEAWYTWTWSPSILFVAAGLILIAGILFLMRGAIEHLLRAVVNRLEIVDEAFIRETDSIIGVSKRLLLSWFLMCCGFILAQYWATLMHGFFRWDDFAILSDNRNYSLVELIFLPFLDHSMPLYRLEQALIVALFGVFPLIYNIFLLSIFIFEIFFVGLIMREMKVSIVNILATITLFTAFAPWGEAISGYYILSVYWQSALLCLVAIWAYLRWVKTGKSIFPIFTISAMGLAPFVDLAGIWVPPAILTFAVCCHVAIPPQEGRKGFWRSHAWVIGGVVSSLLLTAGFNLYVFTSVTSGQFLLLMNSAMPGGTTHSMTNLLHQFFFMVAGGILLPLFFPIGYWRMPTVILVPLLVTLLLVGVGIGWVIWRKADRPSKGYALAVLCIMLGICLLVVAARGYIGFSHAWPIKYTGTPYLWFCVLVGLLLNVLWVQTTGKARVMHLKIIGLILVLYLAIQSIFDIVSNRLVVKVPAFGYGYSSHINGAKARREVLEGLRNDLIIPLLSQSPDHEFRIPSLDGLYIFDIYPILGEYPLEHYQDFIVPAGHKAKFIRNIAMKASVAHNEEIVASLRGETHPYFVKTLETGSYVQRLYLASLPLHFQRRECPDGSLGGGVAAEPGSPAEQDSFKGGETLILDSQGDVMVPIRNRPWDPETAHLLSLNIRALSTAAQTVRIEIAFHGALQIPYPTPWLELTVDEAHCLSVDLLQVYAYALNPQITHLVVRFRTPGRYQISQFTLHSPFATAH
jgi:hypothetical protein